jgi:hypothetical protein
MCPARQRDRHRLRPPRAASNSESSRRCSQVEIGITGVPFFVIDGRFAIPGAQDSETMLAVLERAREKRRLEGAADTSPATAPGDTRVD